ncbi:MAG: TonB-dependent receptor plug domain-containing protein [Desulfococcaceae bacterium]
MMPARMVDRPIFASRAGAILLWALLFHWLPAATAAGGAFEEPDFTALSLEELKNVRITSATKSPEPLTQVPAAVFVITAEDIRRSGVTTIPDALRMAPGVQVARISATEWAVNMRGLNQLFSNKLLVLIDGRSVYSHVFSGVFWDVQDIPLEDIERIEVIRGPGAALWGLNAVNGVINIITRNARHSRGTRITALGGTEEAVATARYGGAVGRNGFYRIFAKSFRRGGLFETDRRIFEDPSRSDWRSYRGGFRYDAQSPELDNQYTLQGGIYSNRFDSDLTLPTFTPPYFRESQDVARATGGHLQGRWTHRFSDHSETALQLYYDYYRSEVETAAVSVHTADVDFQHRFGPHPRHELTWGLNGRLITDEFDGGFEADAHPSEETFAYLGAFLQDRIPLIPGRLNLTLGSKFEHNELTGLEVQPGARLMWTPPGGHFFWGAISRAARAPSRLETDVATRPQVLPPGFAGVEEPTLVEFRGNPDLDAETLIAYEIGYRFSPAKTFWMSASAFFNDYDRLITPWQAERTETGPGGVELQPFVYRNDLRGESYGVEASAFWQAADPLRFQAAYTFLETRIETGFANLDAEFEALFFEESHPRNQVSLRGTWNLLEPLDLDLWFRYVDRLSDADVDSYNTLDARLAWTPRPGLELSLVGQNLLQPNHREFSSIQIERGVYLKVDWVF